jgi:hypothetical protein
VKNGEEIEKVTRAFRFLPPGTIQALGTPESHSLMRLPILASKSQLMHYRNMRTTINLDDKTHEFASVYAAARGITLSAAIAELIRKAESAPTPKPDIRIGPNGLPMLPRTGKVLTTEMVKALSEDEL